MSNQALSTTQQQEYENMENNWNNYETRQENPEQKKWWPVKSLLES